MFSIKLKYIRNLLLFLIFLIPIQDCTRVVLHIPKAILFVHVFVILGLFYCYIEYKKNNCLKTNKTVLILCASYTLLSIISTIINLPRLENVSTTIIQNVCINYSPFWDSPAVSPCYRGIIKPGEILLFIIIMFTLCNTKGYKEKILKTMIYLTIATTIYGVYQIFAFKLGLPGGAFFEVRGSTWNLHEFNGFGIKRINGLFNEGGLHAVFLATPWCILLSQLFEKQNNLILKNKIITGCLFLITSFILLCTFSPISFITILLGSFIYILLAHKHIQWKNLLFKYKYIFLLFLILGVFCIMYCYTTEVETPRIIEYMIRKIEISIYETTDPIVYLNEDSRSVRVLGGIRAFMSAPWFGIGPGNGGYFYWSFIPFVSGKTMMLFCPFINNYICVLAEEGIISFIVFMCLMLYPIFLFWQKRKICSQYRNLTCGMLAGYIVTLVASLQAMLFAKDPTFWIFYILLVTFIRYPYNSKGGYYVKHS